MVTHFREKPRESHDRINGGYFVVEPEVLDLVEDDATVFETTVLVDPGRAGPARGLRARRILDADGHAARAGRAEPHVGVGRRPVGDPMNELTPRGTEVCRGCGSRRTPCPSSTSATSRCPTRWRCSQDDPRPDVPAAPAGLPALRARARSASTSSPSGSSARSTPTCPRSARRGSPTPGAYARAMQEALVLGPDDLVMEIASNDGYLLEQVQALGIRVLGVEPAPASRTSPGPRACRRSRRSSASTRRGAGRRARPPAPGRGQQRDGPRAGPAGLHRRPRAPVRRPHGHHGREPVLPHPAAARPSSTRSTTSTSPTSRAHAVARVVEPFGLALVRVERLSHPRRLQPLLAHAARGAVRSTPSVPATIEEELASGLLSRRPVGVVRGAQPVGHRRPALLARRAARVRPDGRRRTAPRPRATR